MTENVEASTKWFEYLAYQESGRLFFIPVDQSSPHIISDKAVPVLRPYLEAHWFRTETPDTN